MLSVVTNEERITAMLHDVVEDCGVSLADLREAGFSDIVIGAVESVTNRPDESYESFVYRAASNSIGRRVKLADLEDNSDLSRIANPTARDRERVAKYRCAIDTIRAVESSVNPMPMLEPDASGTPPT
jgi:hypothetical protein